MLHATSSNAKFNRCQFRLNHAKYEGGVTYAYDTSLTLWNSVINYNTAMFGGVISATDSNIIIKTSNFSYNIGQAWSAMSIHYGQIILEATTFYKNEMGLIFISDSILLLESIEVIKNTGTNRGLIYAINSVLHGSEEVIMSENVASNSSIIYIEKCKCNFTGIFSFTNNV